MITNIEFDQLPFEEKGSMLEEHGRYVSSLKTPSGATSLYFVHGMFIETQFKAEENIIFDISRLPNNAPVLHRYLARFNVSDFY